MTLKEAILKQYEDKGDWKNFYKNLTHGRSDNKIWTDEDFEHLTEEEISVGTFNYGGIFTITVNGNEGETAHFHFYTNDGRKGCFKIGVPEHFNHGIYKDRLNNKELKIMIGWLKQKPTKNLFRASSTNYEAICDLWNASNEKYAKTFNNAIPNYLLAYS